MKVNNLIFLWKTLNGVKHPDHEHTVEYAKKLKNMFSNSRSANGELLQQFIKRENIEDFEQRKAITRLTTPALINKIMTPFNKALRTDNVNISLGDKEKDLADKFNGNQPLYNYVTTEVHRRAFRDPNAFLVITIPEFDHNTEKAKFLPEIIASKDVLNFKYDHTVLQHAVLQMGSVVKCYNFSEDSDQSECLVARVVDDRSNALEPALMEKDSGELEVVANLVKENTPLYVKAASKTYEIKVYKPHVKHIQVMRIGFIPDDDTDGRTCVTPFNTAIPRMESLIKAKSEMDISIALHVFPQKIQQVEECKGWTGSDGIHTMCRNGFQVGSDKICPNCKGSGHEPIAKSAMDVITTRLGKKPEDDRDLDNIVRYIQTDITTPKFLLEYLKGEELACIQDVFPSKAQEKSVMSTATEIKVDYEDQQDVLLPYNRQIEAIWTFCMDMATQIRDIDSPQYKIRFPDDLDIKTLSELLTDYKESEGMPVAVRRALRKKISRKLSVSDSHSDMRDAVRIIHEPFGDKKVEDIKYLIAQNLVTPEDRILWANYDRIMDKLELKYENWFAMTPAIRDMKIQEYVKSIMDKISPTVVI